MYVYTAYRYNNLRVLLYDIEGGKIYEKNKKIYERQLRLARDRVVKLSRWRHSRPHFAVWPPTLAQNYYSCQSRIFRVALPKFDGRFQAILPENITVKLG